jgi:hypothetical protein
MFENYYDKNSVDLYPKIKNHFCHYVKIIFCDYHYFNNNY